MVLFGHWQEKWMEKIRAFAEKDWLCR